MENNKFKRTKLACYSAYFTMASVFCLPPLLFVTFHQSYGISWTLLGTLVLTNFCTQLGIDLIFSFFSKKFNVALVVKIMPFITSLGLFIYALSPFIFSQNHVFIGLLIGTVIFSVSAGLSEVLLSPIIAAIPSDNPQRDMSKLHSVYAFGVFTIVVLGTLFIKFIGAQYWTYLTAIFALLPLISAVLFILSPFPNVNGNQNAVNSENGKRNLKGVLLCVICIFFGGCAENVMSNWLSGYMETALHIDKAIGDIIGVAGFALLLGFGRMAYAKYGKNVGKILLIGMIGASVCYLVAGFSTQVIPAFIACLLTGVFTSMLWPGSLIMMEENLPGVGVTAYALMAAGGDLGASFAPQLMGIIADNSGLQSGMLVSSIFPILGTVFVIITLKFFKKNKPSAPLLSTNR